LLGSLLLALTAVPQAVAADGAYTSDADFDEGSALNVVHSTADELRLDDTVTPFGFIWVAVSTKGTVVKIDTDTGAILGEYATAPDGQAKNPSRTTVDNNGNVWAGNRDSDSVLRIGLEENGQCEDRNANGVIDTSAGQDDIKAWTDPLGADTAGGVSTAQDECIINYVRVSSSGVRHVSVNRDNDVWVSGIGGRIFDLIDGDTGAIVRTEGSVGYGGYGGLIDANNVIWSAGPHLRWDTANPLDGPNGTNWTGLDHASYGLCIDPDGNVWETEYGPTIRKWSPSGALLGTFNHGFNGAQGCAVSPDGDVWVAHSLDGTSVGRLDNDGTHVGNVEVGDGPTGVAVDGNGKIWATNYASGTVSRIDPNAGPVGGAGEVDFTTVGLGGNPYNYSDMTGSTLSGKPGTGTWSVVYDSGVAGTEWGKATWTDRLPGDSSITVRAASSADAVTFGADEAVIADADLTVADARYLQVTVTFTRSTAGDSPALENLTLRAANDPPIADAGGPYAAEEGDTTQLGGSGSSDPDGDTLTYAWDLDDDGTYETAGESPDFSAAELAAGDYPIELQVCDPSGACDTNSTVVTVTRTELSRDRSTIAFGSRDVDDDGPVTEQATVTNSGTATVTLTGVTLVGTGVAHFVRLTTQGTDCAATTELTIGQTCKLRIRFEPTSTGASSATLTVTSNADNISVALSGTGTRVDTDGDGIGNSADADDDGDSVEDAQDAFPRDPDESVDTDGDGIGNNRDMDDDDDGAIDSRDLYPLDATRHELPKPAPAPAATPTPGPSRIACASRRRFVIRLRPKGVRLTSAIVRVNHKRVAVRKSSGRLHATVDMRGLKKGVYPVTIDARDANGRHYHETRRYRAC
jgi:streptogramin lyase